jgi:outer membrane protein assembly factor BamB
MTDLHGLFESVSRGVGDRPGALARIYSIRRRRRIARRISTVVVALALAVAGGVVALQLRSLEDVRTPASPPITADNAALLATAWSVSIEGAGPAGPAFADGSLYVASEDGRVVAVDASDGTIRWTGRMPPGPVTTPVVADELVIVQAGGRLAAFPSDCAGGSTCSPVWTAESGGAYVSAPAVAGGTAFVPAAPGGITAFSLSCNARCLPVWTAPDPSAHVARTPVVVGDLLWDTSRHRLFAFETSCDDPCSPVQRIAGPTELSSGPAQSDGVLYVGTNDGRLLAIDTRCAASGPCVPVWAGATDGRIEAAPVVDGGTVYVTTSRGTISAFPAACSQPCLPIWHGSLGAPGAQPVTVAGGLVYAPTVDGRVQIFATSCTDICAPVTRLTVAALPTTPTSWDGRAVYTLSADGTLVGWTVNGSAI